MKIEEDEKIELLKTFVKEEEEEEKKEPDNEEKKEGSKNGKKDVSIDNDTGY